MRDSLQVYGVAGYSTVYVTRGAERLQPILQRYRSELAGLSDRLLARRYSRYVRWADRALSMYADGSSWPARGLMAQAFRRLYVAHKLLQERGLHVPERAEAWSDLARAEIYVDNQELFESRATLSRDELEEHLHHVELALPNDPDDVALHQRQLMLWGELQARDRVEHARTGGAVMDVSLATARILRERIVQQMSRRVGYQWTHTEAHATLDALGITVHEPRREPTTFEEIIARADQLEEANV